MADLCLLVNDRKPLHVAKHVVVPLMIYLYYHRQPGSDTRGVGDCKHNNLNKPKPKLLRHGVLGGQHPPAAPLCVHHFVEAQVELGESAYELPRLSHKCDIVVV